MATCPCECHQDQHKHRVGSFSAYIGLAIHAFIDGLVLATTLIADSDIAWIALIGMCVHKFVELFSLSSTFLLSDEEKGTVMKYMISFALITPIGAIISFLLLNGASVDGMIGIPMASEPFSGWDALLAMVQMPPGIPVATVAVNGGANAAILACEMLALSDEGLAEQLRARKAEMIAGVQKKDAALQEKIAEL